MEALEDSKLKRQSNNKAETNYCIAGKFGGGKFGEFSESFMIHQTKTIQISTYK